MKILDVLQLLATLPDDADLILVPNPAMPSAAGYEVLHLAGAVHQDDGTLVIPIAGVHPVYRKPLRPTQPGSDS